MTQPKKILIVDDDPYISHIISYILEEEGYHVLKLDNGRQVIQTVRDEHPDAILLDVRLGDRDGRDICKELKANSTTRNIPIIIVSAINGLENMPNNYCHPNGILTKPFDVSDLINKVHQLVA